ncbi:MAG: hypothetical protein Q9O24_13775 [Gammaproteobacteria bacterium]|nr:hypothetical protein [Gammaproteobacteria bacterium]
MNLLSVVESPNHPNFSALYARFGFAELKVASQRTAMKVVKKTPPDWLVVEFFYGYANNYAGINMCNLDVLFYALQRYAPNSKVVILVQKSERQYVDKLSRIFPIHGVLCQPVAEAEMQELLKNSGLS